MIDRPSMVLPVTVCQAGRETAHNGGTVPHSRHTRRVATLWQLAWKDDRLFCAVYRDEEGFELRVESRTAVIVTERFALQPRALARTEALRASLKRRGWREVRAATSE